MYFNMGMGGGTRKTLITTGDLLNYSCRERRGGVSVQTETLLASGGQGTGRGSW